MKKSKLVLFVLLLIPLSLCGWQIYRANWKSEILGQFADNCQRTAVEISINKISKDNIKLCQKYSLCLRLSEVLPIYFFKAIKNKIGFEVIVFGKQCNGNNNLYAVNLGFVASPFNKQELNKGLVNKTILTNKNLTNKDLANFYLRKYQQAGKFVNMLRAKNNFVEREVYNFDYLDFISDEVKDKYNLQTDFYAQLVKDKSVKDPLKDPLGASKTPLGSSKVLGQTLFVQKIVSPGQTATVPGQTATVPRQTVYKTATVLAQITPVNSLDPPHNRHIGYAITWALLFMSGAFIFVRM